MKLASFTRSKVPFHESRRRLLLAAGAMLLVGKVGASESYFRVDEIKRRMTTMSSLLFESTVADSPRYSDVGQVKSDGAIYTPRELAIFVADQMVKYAKLPTQGRIAILDPAVGDGALLEALLSRLSAEEIERAEVYGFDTSPEAIVCATKRLQQKFARLSIHLEHADFLEHVLNIDSIVGLQSSVLLPRRFDLVIANPPYVRTQVMGAKQAQELARRFSLTGRVDLYFPFLIGISQVLHASGVAGLITSNRFISTRSGQAVRRALLSRFEVLQVWDLGDTKLFNAAVLPAVLLARGTVAAAHPALGEVAYSSIYETKELPEKRATNAITALSETNDSIVGLDDGRRFHVRHGVLENDGDLGGVWRIATHARNGWLDTVKRNTWGTFGQIGKIRVGVKTTADKVFIRNDWQEFGDKVPELLRPLITRHCAQRFKALVPNRAKDRKQILYPHEATEDGRRPVDLTDYPNASRYLEAHREVLEARTYVLQAGRRWYEIWVPQDPASWESAKLVFLDISEKPIFWIDVAGAVVSGECYWLRCENGADSDWLWLALAVANSTFIEAYYDHRFNNKLYAGRRRFITQYVEHFPLPNPNQSHSRAIVALVKRIYETTPSAEATILWDELNSMVWKAFGLVAEEITR